MPTIWTLTMNPCIDKSARVESVVPERKLRCTVPSFEPGGGGVNVSRAIAKLGGESLAFYLAGGPLGQMFHDLLQEEGVRHVVTTVAGNTRESLVVYETSTAQQYRFGMPGPSVREEEWTECLEQLQRTEPKPKFLVASGSLPPGVPKDFYARVSAMAKEFGTSMIVDTVGEPLALAVREGIFLIKPNLRELEAMADQALESEQDQEQLVRRMVKEGKSQVVVVSLGAAGALMAWSEGWERIRAPTVPIKSKVGAGDSMVAGIVVGLERGMSVPEAVRFGVAAGAAAVMTPGTELCRREDTERLYERISGKKMNQSSHQ
jgi:6-phosphofructokinase 2